MLTIQAAYFGFTGIWPLLHLRSFLKVTGPKTDLWLVRTVGLLITAIAATQGYALLRAEISGPVILLSVLSAAFLCAVDITYVAKRVIAPIYLADAAAEVFLLGLWAISV